MHGAGVRELFDVCGAAGRAGNLALCNLFLIALKVREPPFETVVLLADEIVDDHKDSYYSLTNKFLWFICQPP
ncbi:MAG: hypothetical protein A2038_02875 [Deltaproteobacteria bacterium GWA2_57_13]|nr:MAG: hypothetical protein A2038_02875 [Deltaproteobacteria bacterium GWA2_57_13]